MNEIIPLGTKTKLGKIVGILRHQDDPERYYFIQDEQNSIAFIPQSAMKGIL